MCCRYRLGPEPPRCCISSQIWGNVVFSFWGSYRHYIRQIPLFGELNQPLLQVMLTMMIVLVNAELETSDYRGRGGLGCQRLGLFFQALCLPRWSLLHIFVTLFLPTIIGLSWVMAGHPTESTSCILVWCGCWSLWVLRVLVEYTYCCLLYPTSVIVACSDNSRILLTKWRVVSRRGCWSCENTENEKMLMSEKTDCRREDDAEEGKRAAHRGESLMDIFMFTIFCFDY